MKLVTWYIFLLFAPGFAIAQDVSEKENTTVNVNVQVVAPQLLADRGQSAVTELKALYGEPKFGDKPDYYWGIKQTYHLEPGIIGEWNERVFSTLKTYSFSSRQDLVNSNGLQSTAYVGNQTSERNIVTKVVLNETLSLTRERIPEIASLVKALKFEISSENTGTKSEEEAKDKETIEANTAKKTVTEDKVYYKTGVRLKVEGSLLGLISETEVKYNTMTYYYKVNIDHQSDNRLGFKCDVGKDLYIKLERSFTGTIDPVTRDRSNSNMVQLVSKF